MCLIETAHDTQSDGTAELSWQADDILVVRYTGSVSLDFVQQISDQILSRIEAGCRRVLYDVGESTPTFSPVSLLDEVRRLGRAGGKTARFAYWAPENMFSKHFMLIEAAAFNEGIEVKFTSDLEAAKIWLRES
jgi:hypothetical protein